jgi:predicted Rossmann-fold nucleotide-binding protein
MGIVADAALQAGGEVTGVIPADLVRKEVAHPRLSDLRVVDSMHDARP